MKQIITYGLVLAALFGGAEAFPRQIATVCSKALDDRTSTIVKGMSSMPVQQSSTRSTVDEIIFEAPAGETKQYYRDGTSYNLQINWEELMYEIVLVEDEYVTGEVVECADGTFYFRNPVIATPTYSYMKGTREGDEIVFKFPQPVCEVEDLIMSVGLMKLNTDNPMDVTADVVQENNEVRYRINPDGSYSMKLEDGYMLGYYIEDDQSWMFMGTTEQTYHLFHETPVMLPGGVEPKVAQMTFGVNDGRLVKTAIDGNDFYLGGIYDNLPDGWAKGTITDGKVTFEPYQYMGPCEAVYHYVFFAAADIMDILDEENSAECKSITFDYDAEAGTLTYIEDGDAILINGSPRQVYYIEYYMNPVISPYQLVPAVPGNPSGVYFKEFEGTSTVEFAMSVVSVDGKVLDPDHYFYSIYLDDELMEFYPDEYPFLDGVTTEIPVNLNDFDDYTISESFGLHAVTIFSEGYDKVGVQAVYTVDGITNRSAIVYSDGTIASGVEYVSVSEEKSVEYYDITGCRVERPTKGIFIRKSVAADGSVKTEKIMSIRK